jgi:prolyl-tRNA editing enzyme YbaK/EbsC (Cys-tRNA(Pro) deacylase)
MSLENVKLHFQHFGRENDILEMNTSTATVELAAQSLGVEPARIAKTISLKTPGNAMLIVTAGDTKIDNSKYKSEFGFKAKMLTPDEVIEFTGHEIGGVCPFGLINNLSVYLDISLKRFQTVFPACGSSNTAIELSCDELYKYSYGIKWVDVCKIRE